MCTINVIAQDESTLNNGLLVHYKFDGNVNDASANSLHGASFELTFDKDAEGNENSAAYFNGLNAFVALPNLEQLKPELPVTIAFWVNYKSDLTTDRAIFNTSFEENRNTGIFFTEQSSTGNYALGFGDGTYSYSSSTRRSFLSDTKIETDKWIHITLIIKGSTDMKIFVNAVESDGYYSGSGDNLMYSLNSATIGKHDQDINLTAYYFKGLLDDFMCWDRELSNDEVQELFNQKTLTASKNFQKPEFSVFPNPSNGSFQIKTTENILQLSLFNGKGKKVIDYDVGDSSFDTSKLAKGIYFLKISTVKGIKSKKLVIGN